MPSDSEESVSINSFSLSEIDGVGAISIHRKQLIFVMDENN